MLQNLIIFALSVVAVQALGEFTILSTHKSLSFGGNESIKSNEIGELLFTSLGNSVSGNIQWPGLTITDPFHLPKEAIFVSIDGAENIKIPGIKTYPLHGNIVELSLKGAIQLDADGEKVGDGKKDADEKVCVINFEQIDKGAQSFKIIFGDLKTFPIDNLQHLNGNLHTSDKKWLKSLEYLYAIANNFKERKISCKYMHIALFFGDVAKTHGKNSEAVSEALDLALKAVKELNESAQKYNNNEALVVVAVNKADGNSRNKRDVAPDDVKMRFNLAEYYNEDYPVIFNIILWFMVVFGFALLAICYAIGSMDPGRDSIIYRMTSTRMKKDN